jgi:hypothetical protein
MNDDDQQDLYFEAGFALVVIVCVMAFAAMAYWLQA